MHRNLRKSASARHAASRRDAKVRVWVEQLVLPTYLPAAPDRHPMFLEKRVYQGSSGRVYPLPFTDRIAEQPVDRAWRAVWLENAYLRVLILPEIGGRVHRLLDLTTGTDLIYYQPVIKPALVGLAGPWISGGIEFNWPQHHRPATFLPVDVEIEEHPDGSQTVWCGDHDPLARLRGLHGICLRPDEAVVELKVRAYNRTPFVHTFLWWANVAVRVHEAYQSFFPPDVHYVADHARRSMSEYPLAHGRYYGIDYGDRARRGIPAAELPRQFRPLHPASNASVAPRNMPAQAAGPGAALPTYAPNDLRFYANIPTPCSYMAMGSREDFFGGYDHRAQAGLVHVADHRVAPGKKQWTWGNHDFGYAWDRNLTEPDADGVCGPYIELMAGVYTDNQPDFSFLQPGEVKTWSQYWYPIHRIGPAHHANREAAVSLELGSRAIRVGVAVTRRHPGAIVRLDRNDGSAALEWKVDLAPGRPCLVHCPQATRPWRVRTTRLRVLDGTGREILAYRPQPAPRGRIPPPATEPSAPRDIASTDELYLTGLHLEQYRHATRCPTPYWREALRRDPLDARCNTALGIWHLRRGEFATAEHHLQQAIRRLTQRNANPYDGEALYHLGLCLRYLDRDDEAWDALCKATWNQAWAGPASHVLAEIAARREDWPRARDHCERAARQGSENHRLLNLWAMVLRRCGDPTAAESLLQRNRASDPLDWWTRHLLGEPIRCDLQTCLDLAHDHARAGFYAEAIALLETRLTTADLQPRRPRRAAEPQARLPDQSWGARPLVQYTLGWLHERFATASAARPDSAPAPARKRPGTAAALRHYRTAAASPPDYCFPARLEEIAILEAAMRANPSDARAPYYLGNLLYDRRRHAEAIRLWKRAAALDPEFPLVWRNLGLGHFNICRDPNRARRAYERAFQLDPTDARVLYERDQLWKRLGVPPARRLRELERHADRVRQRDDLSVEFCALYNQIGRPEKALRLVRSRRFQPWEGGEGGPLGQWVRSHLALGRAALARSQLAPLRAAARTRWLNAAVQHLESALTPPPNLGEARHLLANPSDLHYSLGCALAERGETRRARAHWHTAATFRGDFQEMRVRAFSEMTYYSALAWKKLGDETRARTLLLELLDYARQLRKTPASIDYFATSLPTMLLFEDDLQSRRETTARFLEAQAALGLGRNRRAQTLLQRVLQRDPNHAAASDLSRELAVWRRCNPTRS